MFLVTSVVLAFTNQSTMAPMHQRHRPCHREKSTAKRNQSHGLQSPLWHSLTL